MTLASSLPDTPLSVSDLVGRSVRWFRANLRFLFRILVVPCLFYELGWEGLSWMTEHPSLPGAGKILAAITLVLVAVSYEVGMRQIAIWRLMFGKDSDYKSALRQSRRPFVLLLFLPSVAVEVIVILWYLFLADFSVQAANSKGSEPMAILDDLFVLLAWLALLMFSLPYTITVFWNSLVACLKESEDLSLLKALGRVFSFQWRAPLFMLWSLGFFAAIGFLLQLPVLALTVTDQLPKLAGGLVGIVLEVITVVIKVGLLTAAQVLFVSYQIAGVTCIYNELRMRLEGADIVQRLNAIKQWQLERG